MDLNVDLQQEFTVKIKTWQDMKNEYGTDNSQTIINCKYGFVSNMEADMPKDRIIKVICDEDGDLRWYPDEKNSTYWDISSDMIDYDMLKDFKNNSIGIGSKVVITSEGSLDLRIGFISDIVDNELHIYVKNPLDGNCTIVRQPHQVLKYF